MVTENNAIYQNNEETSFKNGEVEPAEPVHMNIYQSNTLSLSWLLFDDELRVQER